MRNAGRLKLGYFPLPTEETRSIRALLISPAPYAAIDPCIGDASAVLELTRDTGAFLSGIDWTPIALPPQQQKASQPCTEAHSRPACQPRAARSFT